MFEHFLKHIATFTNLYTQMMMMMEEEETQPKAEEETREEGETDIFFHSFIHSYEI